MHKKQAKFEIFKIDCSKSDHGLESMPERAFEGKSIWRKKMNRSEIHQSSAKIYYFPLSKSFAMRKFEREVAEILRESKDKADSVLAADGWYHDEADIGKRKQM